MGGCWNILWRYCFWSICNMFGKRSKSVWRFRRKGDNTGSKRHCEEPNDFGWKKRKTCHHPELWIRGFNGGHCRRLYNPEWKCGKRRWSLFVNEHHFEQLYSKEQQGFKQWICYFCNKCYDQELSDTWQHIYQ